MTTLVVPVVLDGWQFGCCADPPGVGDEVEWRLEWGEHYRTLLGPRSPRLALPLPLRRMEPPPGSVWLDATPPLVGHNEATVPAVGELGALTVFWAAPAPLPATVPVDGVLHEDHHVDIPTDVARTPGVVRRVRMLSWQYALGDRAWQAVPGTEILTDVRRSPKHIYSAHPADGATLFRDVSGVLADLEVVIG